MNESRTVSERRFALLVLLRHARPTVREILALPAYSGIAPGNVQRYLERDLLSLRESGYNIQVDDEYRYILDDSTNIHVDGGDVEMSILRSLLGAKGKTEAFVSAQSAVTKLLSSAEASQPQARLSIHTPRGDAALKIAPAIQLGRRIAFRYQSATRSSPGRYVVDPLRLEVHFDAFYLRGFQIRGGSGAAGERMYKLDRIAGPVTTLDERITHELDEAVVTTFTPVDAVVRTRRELPLMMRASDVRQVEGGYELTLVGIDRAHLYEDLMFYGLDAELVGPSDLKADFLARIAHLEHLGGGDGHG
ncbi:helix-turn-helix transcriptional regulator [Trueperella pecoris]|uniref:WYL domain-containing protein n=1 Tax=Trueperella pecoris TaxID=2733571 RepID=A0A7M1QYK7_9ACTO|nr:WYL domain-containing protein [Trueperella pecoris]QOQ38841.1 WYL domain-containing protein [Trueperella pecoris]QOR46534.1 WYL domain-containing protein [Trueperella pecoris]QTG74582.1 WYL domain-containing protein [Trueperella pecoris]